MKVVLAGFAVLFPVALLLHGAPAEAAADQAEAMADAIVDTAERGDAEAFGALFTEDGVLMAPDAPRLQGPDAISAFWQGLIDAGGSNLQLTIEDVETSGELAIYTGEYTLDLPGEGGSVNTVGGHYVDVIMRGDDGTWRLHRKIWNSVAPED